MQQIDKKLVQTDRTERRIEDRHFYVLTKLCLWSKHMKGFDVSMYIYIYYINWPQWHSGRVSALGTGGHRFESASNRTESKPLTEWYKLLLCLALST